MKHAIPFLTLALLAGAAPALAQQAPAASPALVESYLAATFGKASPDWQARMKRDETLETCSKSRNKPSAAEAEAIVKREAARMEWPKDGVLPGNWKDGFKVANEGRGGQFSDPPGTVNGGNCYACHQMDPTELSYGTLGPSLKAYGRERKYDPDAAKAAYGKIYNSQAVAACSIMPRFGANRVLSEQQIKDLVAYLFDPDSPVNK